MGKIQKTINFNKKIYNKEALLMGVNAFSDYFYTDIAEDEVYYKVCLLEKLNEDNVINEMRNYVLAKSIEALGC